MGKRYPSEILATCVVPWGEDFELAEVPFRQQVRTVLRKLTRHVYIFGTAGEGYAVDEQQFDRIARVFREETDCAAQVELLEKAPQLQFFFIEMNYARVRDQYECGYLISLGIINFRRAAKRYRVSRRSWKKSIGFCCRPSVLPIS